DGQRVCVHRFAGSPALFQLRLHCLWRRAEVVRLSGAGRKGQVAALARRSRAPVRRRICASSQGIQFAHHALRRSRLARTVESSRMEAQRQVKQSNRTASLSTDIWKTGEVMRLIARLSALAFALTITAALPAPGSAQELSNPRIQF